MEKKTNIKKIIMWLIVCIFALIVVISKSASGDNPKAEMILFYSPGCPHCHHAIEFLNKIEPQYKDLKITKYDTSKRSGVNYYFHYAKKLGISNAGAVPLAIFGENYELGFGSEDTTGKKYIEYIDLMLKTPTKK